MLIKPVSLARDLQLLDTPVAYIRRSDIHLLTARRNAWNSTMLNHYRTIEPTFSNVGSAWNAAERRRKPGTYFEISEERSLVFDLAVFSLVVTHVNAFSPFSSWKIPAAMNVRDSPITGLDAFNMFAGSRYREMVSGWRISDGEPDVLIGIVKSSALRTSDDQSKNRLWRSSVQSGGKMMFNIRQRMEVRDAYLKGISEGLAHLTLQKYPVHEIFLWDGEYFCRKDKTKLVISEPERLVGDGYPVRLTEAPEPSAFCSVCLRWFDGTRH